jgi:hypothetical protein
MAVPQATSPQLLTYTNSSASAQGLGVFEAATGQRLRASKGRNKQENLLGLASPPHPLLPRTRPAKNGRA